MAGMKVLKPIGVSLIPGQETPEDASERIQLLLSNDLGEHGKWQPVLSRWITMRHLEDMIMVHHPPIPIPQDLAMVVATWRMQIIVEHTGKVLMTQEGPEINTHVWEDNGDVEN